MGALWSDPGVSKSFGPGAPHHRGHLYTCTTRKTTDFQGKQPISIINVEIIDMFTMGGGVINKLNFSFWEVLMFDSGAHSFDAIKYMCVLL